MCSFPAFWVPSWEPPHPSPKIKKSNEGFDEELITFGPGVFYDILPDHFDEDQAMHFSSFVLFLTYFKLVGVEVGHFSGFVLRLTNFKFFGSRPCNQTLSSEPAQRPPK